MQLQTPVTIPVQAKAFDYNAHIVCIGSCFARHIGAKLGYYKFDTLTNPFGVLFHPVAIETLLKRALKEQYFNEDDVFFHQERWHCFEVHSQFSNTSKTDLIAQLNAQLIVLKKAIENGTHFIFTFGTAWVYRHINQDKVVANCHKVPQPQFLKELLLPDEVSEVVLSIEQLIKSVRPDAVIINTVSPVRHIKDGITGNARSKAHLLAGILEVSSQENNSFYFPAYEIMMDQLRDYRFYDPDMIHPSPMAIHIIWEKFNTAWILEKTKPLQKKIEEIQNGLQHRPFNPQSEAHQKFLNKLQQKISEIQKELPLVRF